MIPFSFQKGKKTTGCEDAPPVAAVNYSIVCDGLGGAGATKHSIYENGKSVGRTSAYLGARITCDCVKQFYDKHYETIANALNSGNDRAKNVSAIIRELKQNIHDTLLDQASVLGIRRLNSQAVKIFPTTLASAIYCRCGDKLCVLTVWAGDSRVYVLTPDKGLQLLSLDDAFGAADTMGSASEMTNCISAWNDFSLNFSITEVTGPAIIFCCSDGCFDYTASPLHLEWFLLNTILSIMPESNSDTIADIFATNIRDCIYESIGDDTTMAGLLCNMRSTAELREVYKPRMDSFEHSALEMNDALIARNKLQDEKDSASKKCRLFEEKVTQDLHSAVVDTLRKRDTSCLLYAFLMNLPSFSEYQAMVEQVYAEIDEKRSQEIAAYQQETDALKSVCQEMLLLDYIKWQRQNGEGTDTAQMRFPAFIPRGITKRNLGYLKLSTSIQSINACIQLYKHPDFSRIESFVHVREGSLGDYIQHQLSALDDLVSLLNNNSQLFHDMWSQSYFATDRFLADRQQCENFIQQNLEYTLSNPMECAYASELTYQKISEYNNRPNGLAEIQQKYVAIYTNRLDHVPEEYFVRYKNAIVDALLSQSSRYLQDMFSGTTVSIDRLVSYAEARKTMSNIDARILCAQARVTEIWEQYRTDYQRFAQIKESGVA